MIRLAFFVFLRPKFKSKSLGSQNTKYEIRNTIMPKSAKKIISALTLLVGVFFVFHLASAQINLGMEYGNATGLGATDPRLIIGRIIQIFLGFLGVIALGLIVYGGFLWMTAAGNEEQIDRAKRTLVSAIIGLLIILSAFAIATFILNQLLGATGAGGGAGNNPSGPPGGGINGAGAIGECSVQNVYPVPNQMAVPRNTAIFITFKESVDAKTVCASVDASGNCAAGSTINTTNVQIYKSSDSGNPLIDTKVISSDNNKTFTFIPAQYLGSETDNVWYTVNLLGGITRTSDHSSAFSGSGCAGSLNWQFQVSNKIDLTPPQVVSSGVFPPPDNGRDNANLVFAARAVGSITVNAGKPPQYFVAATSSAAKTVSASPTPDADTTVNQNADLSAVIKVVVLPDGLTATATLIDGSNLGSAIFSGRTVFFTGKYPFSLTAHADVKAGDAWTVTITAARQADSLQAGSLVYTFVKKSTQDNEIAVGATAADTANNIAAALGKQTDITVAVSGAQVTVSAAAAGAAGNNINLSFNSPDNSGALSITNMKGGDDGSSTADPNVSTAGNQPDQPMNTVIQINFNEPILPSNVAGAATDASAIQVVNADPNAKSAGGGCAQAADCKSFTCSNKICAGSNEYLQGTFAIANLYQTVEFTSNVPCGVNGCGEPIYCLPPNSHLEVVIKAASLAHCDTNADCAAKNVNGKAYDQCINNICSENLGGNYAATAPEVRRYPAANIQAAPAGGPDGVTDAAFNSLDGDRNSFADGPAATYSDNPPIYSNNQSCQDNFSTIIQAVIAARIKQDKVLGEITGPDAGNYKYYTVGGCTALGATGCLNLMNKEMKDIGLPGAVKDSSGNLFIFDENENEPGYVACRQDAVSSATCGQVNIPTYYCANGDNFSWSFYVNDQMDISAPIVTSVSPAAGEVPKLSQDIKINFNKLMMASTLVTGSTVIDTGQGPVTHKNINLWNVADNPIGYWIQTETLFGGNAPIQTNAIIKHSDFGESSDYRAQAGSAVRDIHENCFKPSGDQSTCKNVSTTQPSCCYGVATSKLDANGDCP